MSVSEKREYRILIAEDEERLLDSLQFMFRRKGHTVFRATTGTDALAILSHHHRDGRPIDLLITDVQMPGMNGEDLVKAVRTFDSVMKILVITAFGDKELVVRLMRLGCRDFVDKPFTPATIESHAESIMADGNRGLQERTNGHQSAILGEEARFLVHDLNNMMCSTLGYAELALKDLEETHPARPKLSKAVASAIVAGEISDRLIAIKTENRKPKKIDCRAGVIIEEMKAVFRGIAPDNVEICTHVSEQALSLTADPQSIHQALLNLGMNALDAMPGGGTLTLRASAEEAAHGADSIPRRCISLAVSDTGRGMSSETLAMVSAGGLTTKTKGHGMGLAGVRIIVEDHGGWMTVSSEIGRGSEFKLFFPVQ